MKQKVERIIHDGQLIAVIMRAGQPPDGANFVTSADAPLQIGTLVKKKGEIVRAHVHEEPVKTVRITQEVLSIERGKMKMYLYEPGGKLIYDGIIQTGDKVLLASGGHGFEVLEDTVIFHVKQGPYPGPAKAKLYLHDSC